MNKRERILAIGLALVFGGFFVQWLYGRWVKVPLDNKVAQVEAAQEKLASLSNEWMAVKEAEAELAEWRRQALPADLQLGQTLYIDWLRGWLADAKIERPTISPMAPRATPTFIRLPFGVRAECTADQLRQLLASFHAAPYLHQIRRLLTDPVFEQGTLQKFVVDLTVEAVSLEDAVTTTHLPPTDETLKPEPDAPPSIAGRNLFQPTKLVRVPPSAPPTTTVRTTPPPPPPPDHRGDYYVTGTVVVDGVPELWLTNRRENKRLVIPQGGTVKIPGLEGRFVGLEGNAVVIEVDGRKGRVPFVQNLNAWKDVDPSPKPAAPPTETAPASDSQPAETTPDQPPAPLSNDAAPAAPTTPVS